MTYEEIICETATIAGAIARLMTRPEISSDEDAYLNRALDDLKIFAVVYRYKKGFQGGLKYGKQKDDED